MRELKRKIVRRKGRMVVTIGPEGIELRGYRCHAQRKLVTWEQIASLADSNDLLAVCERQAGQSEPDRLRAQINLPVPRPTEPVTQPEHAMGKQGLLDLAEFIGCDHCSR